MPQSHNLDEDVGNDVARDPLVDGVQHVAHDALQVKRRDLERAREGEALGGQLLQVSGVAPHGRAPACVRVGVRPEQVGDRRAGLFTNN